MGFLVRSVSIFIAVSVFLNISSAIRCLRSNNIDSVYQLGDSYLDTGNLIRVPGIGSTVPAARLPYGQTFFGRPTGRYSDGLLIIDYLTMALKLPLLNPYLDKNASFSNGVNFGVARATALNLSFFSDRGLSALDDGNIPLTNQTQWFKLYLASISSSPKERSAKLRKSLVVLGEFGTNGLSYAFTHGRSLQEHQTYIPHIVQVIIDSGSARANTSAAEYDEYGCSKSYNNLTTALNTQLQTGLATLRLEFPSLTIIYADFYHAFFSILSRANYLGFDNRSLLRACCGIGGRYNYNGSISSCRVSGGSVRPNQKRSIHWDGIHLTQEAHNRISNVLIPVILSKINCVKWYTNYLLYTYNITIYTCILCSKIRNIIFGVQLKDLQL